MGSYNPKIAEFTRKKRLNIICTLIAKFLNQPDVMQLFNV